MSYPLRMYEPERVYEVTIRTIQGRFLLRPSQEANEIILGIIGRALHWFPNIRIHGFVFLSNHATWLVSSPAPEEIAGFFAYVNGNISREIGRIHDWPGRLWERPHRPIPVLDDDALVARLKYLLAQGCKEGLVHSPKRWPGASCVNALCQQQTLVGTWVSRDALTKAKHRKGGENLSAQDMAQQYEIPLTKIPCWSHLSGDAYASQIRALVRAIEQQAHEEQQRHGKTFLGTQNILAAHPHHRPAQLAKSPAPLCHTSSRDKRKSFYRQYREFVTTFRTAASKLKSGLLTTVFPLFCFPPRRPMITSTA